MYTFVYPPPPPAYASARLIIIRYLEIYTATAEKGEPKVSSLPVTVVLE